MDKLRKILYHPAFATTLRLLQAAGLFVVLYLFWMLGDHLTPFGNVPWLREFLTLITLVLAFVGWTAEGRRPKVAFVIGLVLFLLAGTLLVTQASRLDRVGTKKQLHMWGVYHYYLGSKYFDELGYNDLYEQMVIADWQGKKRYRKLKVIRDLHDYRHKPIKDYRTLPRSEKWTDARWAEFRRDVDYLSRRAGRKTSEGVLADRGYNPPPSYTLVAGFINNTFDIRKIDSQTVLVGFDLLFLFIALTVSIRAYGWNRSFLVFCAFVAFYGNERRIFGQIWVYDYFAASWIAMSMYRLKRYQSAGAALAYAAAVRVFPGVFFVGPIVASLPEIARTRRVPRHLFQFLLGGALVGSLMLGASTARYGTDAWESWAEKIKIHSYHHETGSRRVGIQQLFALDWQHDLKQHPSKVRVRRNLDENRGLYHKVATVFLLLNLLAMLRVRRHDSMLLGSGIMFAGTLASRYYGAFLVLMLLWGVGRGGFMEPDDADDDYAPPPGAAPRARSVLLLTMDGLFLLHIWAAYSMPFMQEQPRMQYQFANLSLAAWYLTMFLVILLRPPRRRELPGPPELDHTDDHSPPAFAMGELPSPEPTHGADEAAATEEPAPAEDNDEPTL